jgi:hypothetical protein
MLNCASQSGMGLSCRFWLVKVTTARHHFAPGIKGDICDLSYHPFESFVLYACCEPAADILHFRS